MQIADLIGKTNHIVVFSYSNPKNGKEETLHGLLTQVDNTSPLGLDVVRIYHENMGFVTTLAKCVKEVLG